MPPKKFLGPRAGAAATADGAPRRRARPALQKPDGWTDEAWDEDCKRRLTETQSRRQRTMKLQQKKGEAAAKKKADDEARIQANVDGYLAASRSALAFPPQHAGSQGVAWASQASISSPASFSPSSPAIMTPRTRFSPSPDYNSDHLGGFNPNVVFPHCPAPRGPHGFNLEVAYGGSPSYTVAPSLHRGPLPFHPSQEASSSHAGNLLGGMSQETYMADLISFGSDAAASGSFYTQEEAHTDAEHGLDSQGLEDEDGEEEKEEEDPEVDVVDPAKTKAKGKRKAKAKLETGPRIKWTHLEDECLAESWKEVSLDACVGAYQNSEKYWKRIRIQDDERRNLNLTYNSITTPRGEKAMQNHWGIIQQQCSKCHGIQEEIERHPESGVGLDEKLNRALGMFRADQKTEFKYHHVFSRISTCEKWADTRTQLAKTKDGTYNPADKADPASEGRPEFGQKKAKAMRALGPPSERLQASIETCLADAKKNAERRDEKADERWKVLMQNQGLKLDLLKNTAASKRRNNDLAFLMGCGESTSSDKAKAWITVHLSSILDGDLPQPPSATPTIDSPSTDPSTASPSSAPSSAATDSAPSTATSGSADQASPEVPPEASPVIYDV